MGSAADAPHGSRPEQVYTRLRDLIVQGLLAPGSRIVETEIATRLGVSRTPVREALQRLQQEGYVDGLARRAAVAPHRGAADARRRVRATQHRWRARRHGSARRGARTDERTRNLVRDLKGLNAEFHRAGKTMPIDHGALRRGPALSPRASSRRAPDRVCSRCTTPSKPQAERYIRMYISMLTGDIRASVYEHDIIIAAIDEGRADDAELAVQVNWRHAADRLSKVIAMAGERGSW